MGEHDYAGQMSCTRHLTEKVHPYTMPCFLELHVKTQSPIKLQIRELIKVDAYGFSNFVCLSLQVHSGS